MLDDFRTTEDLPTDADVCIAGGGPAGISLALNLARRGRSVVLLEAGGGTAPGTAGLDPYGGEVTGRSYPLAGSRLRYLGGSTGHWGGWCRPLDAIEMASRPWLDLPGWPIRRRDLEPWLPAASRWAEIDPELSYDPRIAVPPDSILPDSEGLTTRIFRFSPPTRFGSRYRQALADEPGLRCLLHANVVNVDSRDGEVRALDVRSLDGTRSATFRARRFILALGGIETARLLLNCTSDQPAGLGNGSDFVGRCFMDHFGWPPGVTLTRAGLRYLRFNSDGAAVMPVLTLSEDILEQDRLMMTCLQLTPTGIEPGLPPGVLANPGWAQFDEVSNYRIQMINEPTPNPDSRIRLGDERDALGLRRLEVDFQLAPEALISVDRTVKRLAGLFGSMGLGRIRYQLPATPDSQRQLGFGLHQLGTTRMARDPEYGVVDTDCRVFDTSNLYVLGGGVFSTAGFSNPTLTILALSERLADHLAGGAKAGKGEDA